MEQIKYPLQIRLHKEREMIYFSQLDLVHILERALRRSTLPLFYTQGFNPHPKISFANGLKLGLEGTLKVTFYFSEEVSFDCLKEMLQPQLPQGLDILPPC